MEFIKYQKSFDIKYQIDVSPINNKLITVYRLIKVSIIDVSINGQRTGS